MLPTLEQLHLWIHDAIGVLESTGRDVAGLEDALVALPASYDALVGFAHMLGDRPVRAGWPYVEPVAWGEVLGECDPGCATDPLVPTDASDTARRICAGWRASVCGCQLGKQLEVMPTLAELRAAFTKVGQWPIDDYVTDEALVALGKRNGTGPVRGEHGPAHADDDQNYTVMGLLVLERHGADFTHDHLRRLWETNLPILTTYGPERRGLAAWSVADARKPTGGDLHPLHDLLVFGDVWCGAQIRADAYGYACPGDPQRAAELAYRDATLNHRHTGAYATAWTAAALAAAFVVDEPLDMFRVAQQYIPQRSRFAAAMAQAIKLVERADGWQAGYEAIHAAFGEFGHCRVFQESATLMNTLRFAASVGEGICLQVMQGNDTDSYGATAGALLGVFHDPEGPAALEPRWLAPFGGRVHIGLAGFFETSIDAIGGRLAALPEKLALGSSG
ncbi:MAG: ADP-ribosylglycohydrolase family protein [Planctomycetota bacterium]